MLASAPFPQVPHLQICFPSARSQARSSNMKNWPCFSQLKAFPRLPSSLPTHVVFSYHLRFSLLSSFSCHRSPSPHTCAQSASPLDTLHFNSEPLHKLSPEIGIPLHGPHLGRVHSASQRCPVEFSVTMETSYLFIVQYGST